MSAKKAASEISSALGGQVSIIDQLKSELIQAEAATQGSEKIIAELDKAKAAVVLLTSQLKPFAEARQRVSQLKSAIKSLSAPVSGNRGVIMTDEVKRKLSASHKALWAKKRQAAAAAGSTVTAQA